MSAEELRALDAWIAANVMGLKCPHCVKGVHKKHGPKKYAEMRQWFISRGSPETSWPKREPDILCDHFPRFATDRTAAMEVLERCCNGFDFPVEISQSESGSNWYVHKRTGHGPKELIGVAAETLPLAIALFAKKLFGKE